jgi:hypothetical protein
MVPNQRVPLQKEAAATAKPSVMPEYKNHPMPSRRDSDIRRRLIANTPELAIAVIIGFLTCIFY